MSLCLQGSFHHERREVGPRYSDGPNSTGEQGLRYGANLGNGYGVFDCSPDPQQTEVRIQNQSSVQPWQILSFDLSRGSSIYGASETVQVAGLFVQCLIRYS